MFIYSRRIGLIVNNVLVCALLVAACATPTQTASKQSDSTNTASITQPPVTLPPPSTTQPPVTLPPPSTTQPPVTLPPPSTTQPSTPSPTASKVLLIFAIEDGKDSEKLNDKCLPVADAYEITKAYLNLLRQYFEQGDFVSPPVPNITTKVVRFSNTHYISDAQPEELLPATSIDKLRPNQITTGLIRPLPSRNYQIIKKEKVFSYLDSHSAITDFTEKVVIYFTDGNFQLPKGDNDDYDVEWDKNGNPTNSKKNAILREENQTAAQTSLEKIKNKWSVFPVLRCDLTSLSDNKQWWDDYATLGLNSPIRPWQPKDRFEQAMSGIWRNVLSKYVTIPRSGEFGRIYLAKDGNFFNLNEQLNWETMARCPSGSTVNCIGVDLPPNATKFVGGEIAIAPSSTPKDFFGKLWMIDNVEVSNPEPKPKSKSDLIKIDSVRWDETINTLKDCDTQKWGFQPPDPKISVGERTLFWWRATPAQITTMLPNQNIQYSANVSGSQTKISATVRVDGNDKFSPNFGSCFQAQLWQWENGKASKLIDGTNQLNSQLGWLVNEFADYPPSDSKPPRLEVVVQINSVGPGMKVPTQISQPAQVTVKYIPSLITDKTSCPLNSVTASQAVPPPTPQLAKCIFTFKYIDPKKFNTPPLQVFIERREQKDFPCFTQHHNSQTPKNLFTMPSPASDDQGFTKFDIPLDCGNYIERIAIAWFTPSSLAKSFNDFIGQSGRDITPWVCDAKSCKPQ